MSMGVYINMEMPASCPCELLGIGYDLYCSFAGGIPARVKEYYECCQNGTRPSWCPLVPVPAHGRSIDADALLMRINHEVMEAYMDGVCYGVHPSQEYLDLLGEIIDDAPTIIPAEPAEDGET